MKRICVFCGSSAGQRPIYVKTAQTVGRLIAGRGLELIYGGGNIGLMGAVADAALQAGGNVIGVIPHALMSREIGHIDVTELHIVDSMHERKAIMADLADGFAALPGGFGTFEEFFEIVTWGQLGMHQKPCALLNIEGYYDPLIAMIDYAAEEGMVRQKHRPLVLVETDPARLLDMMENYQPLNLEKWLDRRAT